MYTSCTKPVTKHGDGAPGTGVPDSAGLTPTPRMPMAGLGRRVWDGWRPAAPSVDCVRDHTTLEYCLWKQFSQNDVCCAYTSIPVISLKRLLYAMNRAFLRL